MQFLARVILRKARRHYSTILSKSHYEVLGLPTNATKREIRMAYVQLSKEHHPDKRPELGAKSHNFNLISEAYTVLSNQKTRAAYDYKLLRQRNPHLPPDGHILTKYYTDGTIYSGPMDHDPSSNRFTNGQVVVLTLLFGLVGGLTQLYLVRYFASKREEKAAAIHRENERYLTDARALIAAKGSPLQLSLAEHLSSRGEYAKAIDYTSAPNADEEKK